MSTPRPRGPLRALLSAMRPRQWVKNGILVVAPAAAGRLFEDRVLRQTLVAILAYSLVASGLYLLNDLRDIENDRAHPTKRHRAIPAGQLRVSTAVLAMIVLEVAGFALPLTLARPEGLEFILALYVAITLAYVYWLKNVAVIELGVLASGFFLRAYAGAVASHIFVSTWFLVVISFGALFLAAGKRASELKKVGVGETRAVLAAYTPAFLDSVLTLSATATVTGYCLWAFDTSATGLSSVQHHIVPIRLSVVPVVLAILFIMKSTEAGNGASPEDLLLKDRTVQVLAVVWALLLGAGIYR